MSEGWNIAVWAQLALWAKPCLKRWLNVSSRLGKFMHWHVTKAQANNCALVVRQSPCRMPLNSTGRRRSWHFVAGKEATAAWVEEATNSGCLVIDSSGLFARTRRTAGGAGSKPVCTDRLPQPECHRRTRQSDQPAAGGTETVNRSGRFVAYQCYQPDFSLRPWQKRSMR